MTLGKGVHRSRRATDPVCSDTRPECSQQHPDTKGGAFVGGGGDDVGELRAHIPPRCRCLGEPPVCFPTKLPIYEIGVTSALASANHQLGASHLHLTRCVCVGTGN